VGEPDQTLDAFVAAIAAPDLAALLACLAGSSEPAVWGSEVGEAAVGRAELEPFLRRIASLEHGYRFDFPDRRWTIRGDVAWVVAPGTVVAAPGAPPLPYRLTGVFVREQDGWKLALWSGTEPVTHPSMQ
jgi:ketosteroid isomerase-like protein